MPEKTGIIVDIILIIVIIIALVAYSYCPSSESSCTNSPCVDVKSAQCAASKKCKDRGECSESPDCDSGDVWKKWHKELNSEESKP